MRPAARVHREKICELKEAHVDGHLENFRAGNVHLERQEEQPTEMSALFVPRLLQTDQILVCSYTRRTNRSCSSRVIIVIIVT